VGQKKTRSRLLVLKKRRLSRQVNFGGLAHTAWLQAGRYCFGKENTAEGWITDIFPSTADDPYRIEFSAMKSNTWGYSISSPEVKTGRGGSVPVTCFGVWRYAAATDGHGREKYYCLYPADERMYFLKTHCFSPDIPLRHCLWLLIKEGWRNHRPVTWMQGCFRWKGSAFSLRKEETEISLKKSETDLRKQGNNGGLIGWTDGKTKGLFRQKDIVAPAVERKISEISWAYSAYRRLSFCGYISWGFIILTERELFGRDLLSDRWWSQRSRSPGIARWDSSGDCVVHRNMASAGSQAQ